MSLLRYFLAVCGDFVNFFRKNGTFYSLFMENLYIPNMEKWNEICFHIKDYENSSEKEFQKGVEFIFEKLGWSKFKEEMISKKAIPIGSAQRLIPDIILKNNDKEVIVVELKKNNISSTLRIEQQLFSYMRQLRLEFGIFVGENLQFYYDVPNDNEEPIKIFEANFIENDEKAAEFISLISKPFYENKLLEFCEKRILEATNENIFESLRGDIVKGVFDNEVKILFVELLKGKYDKEVIEKIINDIEIKILLKNEPSVIITDSSIEGLLENEDLTKSEAIDLINGKNKSTNLNNSNTIYSNVNKGKNVWWFEPDNSRFNDDFHLLLNDAKRKILYYFFIPKNEITNPKVIFYQRKDFNNKSQIEIYDNDINLGTARYL